MNSRLAVIFFGALFACLFVVSCRLKGHGGSAGDSCSASRNCRGHLKCWNNTCPCPPRFVQTIGGRCVRPNNIAINATSAGPYYGFTSCVLYQEIELTGLYISAVPYRANLTQACSLIVTESKTIPVDIEEYHEDATVLGVDAVTGAVYLNVNFYPCGPSASDAEPGEAEPVVQTYAVQCIDSRGIVSNTVTFDAIFPSCDVHEPVCP